MRLLWANPTANCFHRQEVFYLFILKNSKTPFIIAANKVDLIAGYKQTTQGIIKNINLQQAYVQERIDTKVYEIVGKLSELGFESERFDRIEDYTKQVGIIPTSAITGEGIAELLMVLCGLAQKFLEDNLKLNVVGQAKGTILEIKETKGLGKTMDAIIYEGSLNKGDNIVIGGVDKPIVTRIKALFEPAPLSEMRDKKSKFVAVKQVTAATGVKISAPGIDNVIAGMPIQSYTDKIKTQVSEEIQKQVKDVVVETGDSGIIIKADTLGSLEALTFLLKEKEIPVRKARIGKISKKDITDAESNYDKDPLQAVVLGFNVEREPDVSGGEKVKIITHDIIYKIIEEFIVWQSQQKDRIEAKALDKVTRPCKFEFMRNHVFRQNNPAIIGCDIIEGVLSTGIRVMKDGEPIGSVKTIMQEKDSLRTVNKGKQVAVSIDGVTVGRQIKEGDMFYSYIPEPDFREIKKLAKFLSKGEIEVLKEIAAMMRKKNSIWGV